MKITENSIIEQNKASVVKTSRGISIFVPSAIAKDMKLEVGGPFYYSYTNGTFQVSGQSPDVQIPPLKMSDFDIPAASVSHQE